MALVRPGGPPGGAAPPPGAGAPPPGPYGGPAWRPPASLTPPNIGNLNAGAGHPASFYNSALSTGAAGAGMGHGGGYEVTGAGTHPALQHILGTTALGTPPTGPPAWWPQGAPWPPPARNWFGGPGGPPTGGDPYGPPVAPPPPHWVGPPVRPPTGPSPLLSYLHGYYTIANGG